MDPRRGERDQLALPGRSPKTRAAGGLAQQDRRGGQVGDVEPLDDQQTCARVQQLEWNSAQDPVGDDDQVGGVGPSEHRDSAQQPRSDLGGGRLPPVGRARGCLLQQR